MKYAFQNIPHLATAIGSEAASGPKQAEVRHLLHAYLVWADDRILAVGEGELPESHRDATVLPFEGKLLTAGLVDCHTHLVFGGWRSHEFSEKLQGVPYLTILENGGGILSTVRATRAASFSELLEKSARLLREAMAHGTTAMEIKSGYGLDEETERKQLLVAAALKEENPDLSLTYLGAHAVPQGMEKSRYVQTIVEEILPRLAKDRLCDACDVFCDRGVFDAEDSRRILKAAQALGMQIKLHADEIACIGGTTTAKELHAISCDHLSETKKDGMQELKDGGVIAVMLPATSFYLNKPYGSFREMIGLGIPVAVATDFNPGSTPCLSLPFAMTVACLYGKLTPEEALTAATLNGAAALRMADRLGTLECGKQADFVVWDAEDLNELLYRYGTNRAVAVYKKGKRFL